MKKHSIKQQLIAAFIGILAFTIILCFVLNNFFLERFYLLDKQETFENNITTVRELMEEEDIDGLKSIMARMRYSDNISFIQVAESWVVMGISANFTSENETVDMLKRMQNNFNKNGQANTDEPYLIKELKVTDSYVIQEKRYLATNTSYMECYGYLADNTKFMMSTPLESVKDSVEFANRFLLITSLISMALAIGLISLIVNGFTRPILQLADISRHMANLDFESRYTGDQTNEVAILGHSMNQMADQLKLTIEELQQANETLKRDIEEKIQIDEVRKEFLSNVSHELKTPIALIQGYAEGLQEVVNDDPESQKFYCEVIIDEADKMNNMVKKLLTLNHLEFGQDALNKEDFDLSEMMDAVIESNRLIGEKKDVTFMKNYAGPCPVLADEFKMEEVCTNYISNAINHADGDKKITVSIEEEETCFRVTVRNTGKPIPEEELDKIWIKFYKVDKARTREYGGSGIGLSIVKAIMDAHKQPFGVCNTEDGVAFWFCLEKFSPAAPAVKEDEEPALLFGSANEEGSSEW